MYWLDSDRVNSIEELSEEFLKDKGKYSFDHSLNAITDTRSYKWYGVPLKEFISPLSEKRKVLKQMKDPQSQALQDSIKLVINTTWGLLTSQYFDNDAMVLCPAPEHLFFI